MKVVSCYDKIEDGMIQTVTLKVEEDGKCLQEATFEIVEDGTVAVFKSNHLYIDDENMIKRCFDEMDGYTQGHVEQKSDVLFRVPKTSYFRTRYREMSIRLAHSAEI